MSQALISRRAKWATYLHIQLWVFSIKPKLRCVFPSQRIRAGNQRVSLDEQLQLQALGKIVHSFENSL